MHSILMLYSSLLERLTAPSNNDEHDLIRRPTMAGLETLYPSLLILTIE